MRLAHLFTSSALVFATMFPIAASASGVAPEWRVKDRFRLFDKADVDAKESVNQLLDVLRTASSLENEALYAAILNVFSETTAAEVKLLLDELRTAVVSGNKVRQDEILKTLAQTKIAISHSASLRKSNYIAAGPAAPRTSGRYERAYLYPEKYAIEIRGTSDPALFLAKCRYESSLEVSEGPCGEWVSLDVAEGQTASKHDWKVEAKVRMSIAGAASIPLDISFRDRLVVALGDSYISGEGNPDVPSVISDRPDPIFAKAGWGGEAQLGVHVMSAAKWWDEPCHRSLLSWPVLATLSHSGRNPNEAVTLVHLGCSGAVAKDIYLHGEGDLPGGGDETESQLSQLQWLMRRPSSEWGARTVDSVLLSIGGNDIGFAGVVSTILLPPNGFTFGPLIAREVGKGARAVCAYEDSGKPISRLCRQELSAERRLEDLPSELAALRHAFAKLGIMAPVLHTQYPNPLIGLDGQACDTNQQNDDRTAPIMPRHNKSDNMRFDDGFEALMGVIPKNRRGSRYSWRYELMYLPESRYKKKPEGSPILRDYPKIDCDNFRDAHDSEVCQGLLTHSELNTAVGHTALGWTTISSHIETTNRHGLCMGDNDYRLVMPRVIKDKKSNKWKWQGAKPSKFMPYHWTKTRWFRTTNDSIQTQFGYFNGKPRFHHGTAHPTFRAHLNYADAILANGIFKKAE